MSPPVHACNRHFEGERSGLCAAAGCGSDDTGSKSNGGAGGTAATGGTGASGGTAATGGTGASGGTAATGGTGASGGTGAAGGSGGAAGSDGAAGSGGQTCAPVDAGSGGTGGSTDGGVINVKGTINEFQQSTTDGGAAIPISGAQVCLQGTTNCANSDATGAVTLANVPASAEIVLLLTKTGYANVALVFTTGPGEFTFLSTMPTATLAKVFAAAAGISWPLDGHGIILSGTLETQTVDGGDGGTTTNSALAGSTLSMTPAAPVGPVYVSDQQFPDPTLTSTSKFGWAGFGGLCPATYTVKAAHTGRTCKRLAFSGWKGPTDDTAKIPAVADHIVGNVNFLCNP